MAEQTFRSPGFFDQEIDLAAKEETPIGIGAGIIGTAEKGPAFVPVTVGTFADFQNRFGDIHPERFGPYAVREFLKSRNAITYLRVLGAGANETSTHIDTTRDYGIVQNAGFHVSGSSSATLASAQLGGGAGTETDTRGRAPGMVQFLAAKHTVSASADIGFPVFTDNDSFSGLQESSTTRTNDTAHLIRGMLFTTTASQFYIASGTISTAAYEAVNIENQHVGLKGYGNEANLFKMICSSSLGQTFGDDDGFNGYKIFTCSLDPNSPYYVAKVLNTDPRKFQSEQHLLYAHFPVENELAPVSNYRADTSAQPGWNSVALLSGTHHTADHTWGTAANGDRTFASAFGNFRSRYTTPKTTTFISQPFGNAEHDLFHFETMSDGAWGNDKVKVSITNLRASTDPTYNFGTFDVLIRRFDDIDTAPQILERFVNCSIDPSNERFIARLIGDKKVRYNFDSDLEEERRLVISGRYPNRSLNIRVIMADAVYKRNVPEECLPFGFHGIPVLKTAHDSGGQPVEGNVTVAAGTVMRLTCGIPTAAAAADVTGANALSASILPPLPFRFKCTRNKVQDGTSAYYIGYPGSDERVDHRLYWGVKFTRLPLTSSLTDAVLRANDSTQHNELIENYSKFMGMSKLDVLHTGSFIDKFNNNKFTLARVSLGNQLDASGHITDVSGTAKVHMKEAAYIRNGAPNPNNYTITDAVWAKPRITMATLINSSSTVFNRFSTYNKFTNIFHGGFDGINILDPDVRKMNDRAASTENDYGGKAGYDISGGLGLLGTDNSNLMGSGKSNNIVASYRSAINIMTDPMTTNINLVAVPGIRDAYITDYAAQKTQEYSMAMYVMDIPSYNADGNRIFIDTKSSKPDVNKTAEEFEARQIDNNYAATYWPDIYLDDPVHQRRVLAPPSVAAISALGFNDAVAYPWFAPAGFNRAALGFVSNIKVRLNTADRDKLYDARVNPIATFSGGGFVVFGQKTLQQAQSALDRVNVRRMLLEVKRQVVGVADRLLFEQNNKATRDRFIGQVTPKLALIQSQQGIESFSVVMDESNNSDQDREENKLNGRIVVVPTRAVEFIAVDFIITNSGVLFE